jgi:hypothetical protein
MAPAWHQRRVSRIDLIGLDHFLTEIKIGNRVIAGKVVPRDRIELSTPAFLGPEKIECNQGVKRKME